MKDSVGLIKALDGRFVDKTTEMDQDIEEILKKIRNIEQDVLKKMADLGKEDNFTLSFNAHEETIQKLED